MSFDVALQKVGFIARFGRSNRTSGHGQSLRDRSCKDSSGNVHTTGAPRGRVRQDRCYPQGGSELREQEQRSREQLAGKKAEFFKLSVELAIAGSTYS